MLVQLLPYGVVRRGAAEAKMGQKVGTLSHWAFLPFPALEAAQATWQGLQQELQSHPYPWLTGSSGIGPGSQQSQGLGLAPSPVS